jgi:hypothetical protein
MSFITIGGATTTDPTVGGNAFGIVSVSGQSPVVADSPSDTLTLTAGDNIVITTDAFNSEVIITAARR